MGTKNHSMKLSVTATEMQLREQAPIVFRGSFEKTFPLIRDAGFDGVEAHIHDSSECNATRLSKLLEQNHLCLTSIGTGSAYAKDRIFLSAEDPSTREKAVERIKGHLDLACGFSGAVVILGLIRGKLTDCSSREAYEANLLKSLEECVKHASERKAVLVMELINRYEADTLNTIGEGLQLLEKLPSPWLKLHLDTYHMNIEEADITEAIKGAGSRIGHVHVADNDRWYPGHGHYPFSETVNALKQVSYSGALALECLFYPDALTAARKGKMHMRCIMDNSFF